MNMDDADPRGLEALGVSMEDALRGADWLAEVLRQDPTLSVHLGMLEAELHHRGMEGPWPRRWWKRARWLLWGKRKRRREEPRR